MTRLSRRRLAGLLPPPPSPASKLSLFLGLSCVLPDEITVGRGGKVGCGGGAKIIRRRESLVKTLLSYTLPVSTTLYPKLYRWFPVQTCLLKRKSPLLSTSVTYVKKGKRENIASLALRRIWLTPFIPIFFTNNQPCTTNVRRIIPTGIKLPFSMTWLLITLPSGRHSYFHYHKERPFKGASMVHCPKTLRIKILLQKSMLYKT